MQLVLPAVKRVRLAEAQAEVARFGERAASRFFVFEVPRGAEAELRELFRLAKEKHGDFLHLILGTPKRPRSRRQNNGVFAWCGDIAEQFAAAGQYEGYSLEEIKARVYEAMKRLAVNEAGWPTVMNPVDGSLEPMSQAFASVEQDNALINIVKRFADENGLWLVEMVEGKPTKCLGGRPLEE